MTTNCQPLSQPAFTKARRDNLQKPIPFACQDWANTKGAYRFFSNDRINEKQLLSRHFQSTQERFTKTKDIILVLHDTTLFSFQRAHPEKIGMAHSLANGNLFSQQRTITTCGILMHSSLAITTAGLPLGLPAIKFWTRKKFKGTNALKKCINQTRISIKKKGKLSLAREFKTINRVIEYS